MANSHIWNWNRTVLIRKSHVSSIKIEPGSLTELPSLTCMTLCYRGWNVEVNVRGNTETLAKYFKTEDDARQWIKDNYLSKSKSGSENKEASDANGEAHT